MLSLPAFRCKWRRGHGSRMTPRRFWRVHPILLLLLCLGCGRGVESERFTQAPSHGMGVHFSVSCSDPAQAMFDQALTAEHMFLHEQASGLFVQALQLDQSCAMAYWGMALAGLDNLFLTPGSDIVAKARTLLRPVETLPAGSPLETGFIGALQSLLDKRCSWEACTRAFMLAHKQLAARYPNDVEAQVFYAAALIMSAPTDDTGYAQQREAAAILEKLFATYPSHPGVAHYLIHAYDTPPDAKKGLPAARRFAMMAHGSAHALHMPSHIFTRLGYWTESIDSNLRSAAAARAADAANDELHARDYLVYAYLQTGQSRAAKQAVRESKVAEGHLNPTTLGGPFAAAAMPARLALETGDWRRAASVRIAISTEFPQVEAISHFSRALGLARSGDAAAAEDELVRLAQLEEKLGEQGKFYWQRQAGIQYLSAHAWSSFASGRRQEGLAEMRAAADLESHTNKNVVTPGPLAPARELLGEMLLGSDRSRDAQREFEAVLDTEPNRFRSVYGAARSAELAGDLQAATKGYSRLLQIAAKADTDRLELRQAAKFLTNHTR